MNRLAPWRLCWFCGRRGTVGEKWNWGDSIGSGGCILYRSNHLLRKVMEPTYLPEKVIIHPQSSPIIIWQGDWILRILRVCKNLASDCFSGGRYFWRYIGFLTTTSLWFLGFVFFVVLIFPPHQLEFKIILPFPWKGTWSIHPSFLGLMSVFRV